MNLYPMLTSMRLKQLFLWTRKIQLCFDSEYVSRDASWSLEAFTAHRSHPRANPFHKHRR